MLSVDIKGCTDCGSLSEVLQQIDTEIYYLSKLRDENVRFDLNMCVDEGTIEKLVLYKNILQRRLRNPEYIGCCNIPLGDIISKVKTMISATSVLNCKFKKSTFVN